MFIEFHATFLDAHALTNMFTLDATATWAEKIIRPIIVYAALVIMLRVFGKRELAQLNPFDLVVILSLSNTVQNAIIGPDNSLVGGIVGAIALLAINFLFSRMKYASKTIEAAAEGVPVALIQNGVKDAVQMKRELITERDLEIIAHQKGFDDPNDIEKLVIDPNGSFLIDGKDGIRDEKFKKEVLRKIANLSDQLTKLNSALQKG
ncbi:MAG TPA: hypothetical protein PLP07_10555 [Pyrinomonadaceae bacterium]|nr:DUF421 domain-containing protein [Chloracidobacterium sp.]MBP9934319.1 DUF421 domain-containing protein [Pyrinomonadaceae bacterium]MBK9436803.1 DUF421 domain-containing protein [Chloracidobacterium sp.]MBK9766453.1 DUF421 domain-containing protein [Chloracidobacterium sp.]MBL0241795.1 DUF421 domain-containing protein [Chloracidobacterium sp.]